MRNAPAGLADLARAYGALNPPQDACRPIARLLGLDGVIAFFETPVPLAPSTPPPAVPAAASVRAMTSGESDSGTAGSRESASTVEKPPPPPIYAQAERSRPRSQGPRPNPIGVPIKLTEIRLPASGEMPQYVSDADELAFDSGAVRRLPVPEPLVPFAQLRSLIADLIAAPVPGDPDIKRLVRDLARGRVPHVLPRKERKGAARRIHVLVDTADSMRLFNHDAAALLNAFRAVAGPAIQSESITSGPPTHLFPAYARGDTLLVISDLGIGSRRARPARIAAWHDFTTLQRSRGLRVVALVPFHFTRWPAVLKRSMRLVHWHRPGSVAPPASPEQLRRLARALSLAAVIDPALLRAARLRVISTADAGAEADFANGRWTSFFNPRVIGLLPSWTVRLRSELANDEPLLELARRLLAEERPNGSDWDRVIYEEQIIFLALQSNDGASHELERAIGRVIRTDRKS